MGFLSKLFGKLRLPGSAPVAQAPAPPPPPAAEPRGQEPQQDRGEGEHEPPAGGAS